MKVAGALTLVLGFIASLVLLLLPTSVSVLGTDIDCGLPVRGIFGYEDESSEVDVIDLGEDTGPSYESQQCQRNSVIRVGIGAGIGVVAFIGGMLMLLLSPSAEDRERERRKEEHQQFMRWQWEHDRRKEWDAQQRQQREAHQPPANPE